MQPFPWCLRAPDSSVEDLLFHLPWDSPHDDNSFQAYFQHAFLDPPDSSPVDKNLAEPSEEAKTASSTTCHSPSLTHKMPHRSRTRTEVDRLRHRDFCKGKRRLSTLEREEIVNIWNSRSLDDSRTTQAQIARIFGKRKSAISRFLRPQQRSDGGDSGDEESQTPGPSSCTTQAPRSPRSDDQVREIAFSICATAFGRMLPQCKLELLMDQTGAPVNGLPQLLNRIDTDLGLLRGSYHLCYRDEDEDEIVVTCDNGLGVVMSEVASNKAVALYLKRK